MRLAERVIGRIVAILLVGACRLLLTIDKARKRYEAAYHVGLIVVVSPVALLIWNEIEPLLHRFGGRFDSHSLYQVFHYVAILIVSFLLSSLLKAVLPWFLYLPYANEMRALGLLRISTDNGGVLQLLETYLKGHETTKPVKVICISGRHLFREPRPPLTRAPLGDVARSGRLDVVMPVANPRNSTILSRYQSYDPVFRQAVYPEIDELVREVEASHKFLATLGNTVTSHDLLCFWRVIILSHVCLVQSYFPNAVGGDSDTAPTFVFENTPESSYSYYLTFSTMFDLAKQHNGLRNTGT